MLLVVSIPQVAQIRLKQKLEGGINGPKKRRLSYRHSVWCVKGWRAVTKRQYLCTCECGNVVERTATSLGSGAKHCGCGRGTKRRFKSTLSPEEIESNKRAKQMEVELRKATHCPYPLNSCRLNRKLGLCCNDCITPCDERCLNTKDKCRK